MLCLPLLLPHMVGPAIALSGLLQNRSFLPPMPQHRQPPSDLQPQPLLLLPPCTHISKQFTPRFGFSLSSDSAVFLPCIGPAWFAISLATFGYEKSLFAQGAEPWPMTCSASVCLCHIHMRLVQKHGKAHSACYECSKTGAKLSQPAASRGTEWAEPHATHVSQPEQDQYALSSRHSCLNRLACSMQRWRLAAHWHSKATAGSTCMA